MAWPLSYPGTVPAGSYLFLGDSIEPLAGDPPPTGGRTALVACGSNASPDRLRHKFAGSDVDPTMPVLRATVTGAVSVYSAHVSRYGAIPATLMHLDGAATDLFVQFVDDEQLHLIERSERRSYALAPLDPSRHPVTLSSGRPVDQCWCFASTFGALALDGEPVGLAAFPSASLAAMTHEDLWSTIADRWRESYPSLPTEPGAIMAAMRGPDELSMTIRDAFDSIVGARPHGFEPDDRSAHRGAP